MAVPTPIPIPVPILYHATHSSRPSEPLPPVAGFGLFLALNIGILLLIGVIYSLTFKSPYPIGKGEKAVGIVILLATTLFWISMNLAILGI